MASTKRKIPDLGLQRRVRPRVEPEPESDVDDSSSEVPSEEGVDSAGSEDEGGDSASEVSEDESEPDSEEGDPAGLDASQLSFGALARAQASLPPARKKGAAAEKEGLADEDGNPPRELYDGKPRLSAAEQREKHKRSSKHAPAELTSKKRVSRRRDFVDLPKAQARDPRFMPLGAGSSVAASQGVLGQLEEIKARKAYSFLDDYQEDELKQLRAAAKKEKDPQIKEKLERAMMSMESRLKAQKRKDRERELLDEHRKQEKELVKQGKQPFYLKKSEQKKALLLDQFSTMKKGQVDHAIERRRKKVASKEKKLLPWARRTAEER